MRARRRAPALLALVAFGLAVAAAAPAQTLYKWTDAQGKVQYSDRPPKNFTGEVTRIPIDAAPAPAPAKPAAPAVKEAAPAVDKPVDDIAARRRALRERLGADVARAREKLEAARAALENAGGPEVDERQVVQQRFAKGTRPAQARSNCREVAGADGRKSLMCPALVPGEGYYERIRLLEEALKRAEEELEAAERAYRRGVD